MHLLHHADEGLQLVREIEGGDRAQALELQDGLTNQDSGTLSRLIYVLEFNWRVVV
jgi:hypothetical protein